MIKDKLKDKLKDKVVAVLVAGPYDKVFDYRLAEGMEVQIGNWVIVPVRGKSRAGLVFTAPFARSESKVPQGKLLAIASKLPVPAVGADFIQFIRKTASYNMAKIGMVLKLSAAQLDFTKAEKIHFLYELPPAGASGGSDKTLNPKRQKLLEILQKQTPQKQTPQKPAPMEKNDLLAASGVSAALLKSMVEDKQLNKIPAPKKIIPQPDPDFYKITPSKLQQPVITKLKQICNAQKFQTILLYGQTGSGKTEIYLEAIADIFTRWKTAFNFATRNSSIATIFTTLPATFWLPANNLAFCLNG